MPAAVETYIGQHGLYSRGGLTRRSANHLHGQDESNDQTTNDQADGSGCRRKSTRAVRAALDKKATDVVVLDLRHTPAFTDFFVLCSGQNTRQVKAIADSVEDTLRAPRCGRRTSKATTAPTGS